MPTARLFLLFVLASLTMAACGGADAKKASGPEDDVRRAATTLIRTKSARVTCSLLTPRLVEEIYRSPSKCRSTPVGDGQASSSSRVGAIAVTDRTAQVEIRLNYRGQRGRGHLAFVEQAGRWKADRYGDDFLRATLQTAVQGTTSGAFSGEAMHRCMAGKVAGLPAATVRTYLYKATRQDPDARTTFVDLAARCPVPLARFVAHRLMDAVKKQGKSAADLRCIEGTMAHVLVLKPLVQSALQKKADPADAAALAGVVQGAADTCRTRAR